MRTKKLFLILALLCAVAQGAWAQNFDVWDGVTETKPQEIARVIYIKKASDLAYLRKHFRDYIWNEHNEVNTSLSGTTHHIAYNSAFELPISLQADIDMGDAVSWVPLGWAERTGWSWGENHYEGTFNGNGHTIRIHIKDVTDNYQGLFSGIASNGRVENVHVVADIHCSSSRLVGGIAGENDGTIENCWVSGTVRSDWKEPSSPNKAKVGGIAGENNGTIQFCCMAGDVTNDDADVGGLVGCNDGTLSHCTFYGTRHSSHDQASIYVGKYGTEEYLFGIFSLDEYNAASGKDMYRHAIRYTYDVTVNIEGHGTVRTRALDEDDVPGTCAGQTFSLNVTSGTALNVTVTDADGNNVPLQGHANDNSSFWFVMPSKNVTATVTFGYTDWPTQGAGTVDDPYIISSADDWYDFAHNVRIGRSYSGNYVKLTSDISVSTMAGAYQADDNYQPFGGTFDGDGHKLTLNVSNQSRFAAPFKCVSGATIKNLRTAGTISGGNNADGKLLAGIVGVSFGNTTITNCVSSVTLTTDFGEDAALAGIVAGTKGGSLTIEGCVFDGSMTGASNTRCAGIAGFEYEATTTTITNTLFAPATLTVSTTDETYTKTFTRDGDATITNCYYTKVLGAAQGTEAVALNEAPANLGALVQDYGMVKTYEHGILFDGIYYMDYNYAPTLPMLSDANAEDIGKVVCAAGHLHPAKIAVPDGCTAVGILGNLTADGHGLIIALQGATSQTWNTINGWTSVTTYAGTTLKVLPDDAARGSLTSITKLGSVAVSNWCVAQKSDYEAIFINFGSTTRGPDGTTYDHNVNAYITGAGGTALDGMYWSASEDPSQEWGGWFFSNHKWGKYSEAQAVGVRPVLGFNITICNLSGTGTEDDPYLIGSTDDWNNFAAVVSGGNTFSGKFVKLTSDISVSTMAGASDANSFQGTFDGDCHTLTLNMSDFTEQYLAPFRYVGNATIKNLKTAGTRSTSGQYAGGLIANIVNGSTVSIEGCVSSVTISSTSYTNSGFVSRLGDNSQLTIRGCAFVGSLEGSESRNNAGFVGYCQSGSTATIEDCLFAPDHISTGLANCQTFVRGDATWLIDRCYYTQAYGAAQGTAAVATATAPANLGDAFEDYGMVKAYAHGILVGGTYYGVSAGNVSLADDDDNSTTISSVNGCVADVTLQGRTLYKDGGWNTLCLPFSVDNFTGTPLEGATVKTLELTSFTGGTLTMNFSDAVTSIEAGKPYIVKWDKADDYVDDDAHNIVTPVFNGVTISDAPANVSTDYVDFVGTYSPVSIYTAEKTNLYLGADNTLYYPTDEGFKVNACRGYFRLKRLTAGDITSGAIELNFGEDEATGIQTTNFTNPTNSGNEWYSLDGRKLDGKPTQRGIYVNNGKKVAIK